MADELQSQLIPDVSGANFAASWTGKANSLALERGDKWSIYSNGAAVGAGVSIEISDTEDGASGWYTSGLVTTANVTHITDPPACRAVRLNGIAAANPAPARFLVRHGWT